MGQSSADGADEPIVGQRPLPESWPCVATLAQDEETAAWLASQNRRTKQVIRAKRHMEAKAMTREDHVGTLRRRAEVSEANATKLQQIIEDLQAEAWIVAAQSPAARACSEPRFRAGQSVLQWWANWFKNEGPAPKAYSKKKRPAWYSGEILNPAVWTEGKDYAGVKYTGWVYPTH